MKAWISQIGSVVSALAASICCLGPMLGIVLGIGGLGAAASLGAYRPYFLGMTSICLGAAFYFTYGRKPACESGGGGRRNRALLWIATAVALVFAAAPYLLSLGV